MFHSQPLVFQNLWWLAGEVEDRAFKKADRDHSKNVRLTVSSLDKTLIYSCFANTVKMKTEERCTQDNSCLVFLRDLLSHDLRRVPIDTGRKLNVHKTFRRRRGRLLNVLCMFNLSPASVGKSP